MDAEARSAILKSADWLTATQFFELAGLSERNADAQFGQWKREGRIFALHRDGRDYYPAYALDPESGYRPVAGLVSILKRFKGEMVEWDIAIWFVSVNSFLGGKMPKDLLLSAPNDVLAAAKDELAGILHG
jgi:hypothetical protein